MNKFLHPVDAVEAKANLENIINNEVENRVATQEMYQNKITSIKIDENRINKMFELLTIDKVAKTSEKYENACRMLDFYKKTYNCDDNQNYKGTLMGFVNTCTNINSRKKESPLDVVKPVLSTKILNSPCDFEYLCKDAIIHAGC